MKIRASLLSRMVAFVLLLAVGLGTAALAQQNPVHPVLSFSSYLLSPADRINAVKVGNDGSVYVAGVTLSHATAFDATRQSAGEGRAFVAKFSPDGAKLVYFTYLSNSTSDEARAIAVDSAGNAYVAGATRATDFAVVKAFQPSCKLDGAGQCAGTAFVGKVNAAGAVVFATYLGGSGHDEANAIAVDDHGNMFVAGSTQSLDFPVENAVQQAAVGNGDAFVSAIAADGSRLLFSTYLGGSDSDEALALALDADGSVYLTGKTTSLDFPTEGPLQAQCRTNARGECSGAAFVTKLSADGKTIQYSTYLGGSGGDAGNTITVDARGNAYVAGVTSSNDFPTANAEQAVLKGRSNAFVSEISSRGSALLFSTFLGGTGADQANAIALDKSGNVVVAGWTYSPDFPLQDPLQSACNRDKNGACSLDAFVAALNPADSQLHFSTYLGGSGADVSRALAIDAQGSAYLGGWTTSRDFAQAKTPIAPAGMMTAGSASPRKLGGAFLAKISGLNDSKAQPGACTNNWTGAAGNNQWGTAGNWSSNSVPVAADSVCIASTFTNTITIGALGSSNQSISSLNSGAPISFTSGPLTVSGTSIVGANLAVSGGTLTFDGAASMTTLNLNGSGTMTGTGLVTVSGTMTWAGGIVSGTGGLTIASGATLNITATAYYVELYTTLNNQGTVVEAGVTYGVYVRNPGVINNLGSWTVSSNDTVHADSGVVVFNNNSPGTFVQSGVTGTTTWQVPINGSGSINVTSGTLFLSGASIGSITGIINVGSGAALDYAQGGTLAGKQVTGTGTMTFLTATTTVTGTYSFAGTTQIQSGTVSFSGATSMTTLNLNGSGTMTGTGLVTVSGTMTWAGGIVSGTGGLTIASGATLNITATAYYVELYTTLNNQGTVVEAGVTYGVYVRNPGVINNSSSWTVSSNDTVFADQGAVVFNNTGTFVQNGVTGTTTWQVPINGSGSISVTSGTLFLSGASIGSITGIINVGSGAALDYAQGGTLAGKQVTGTGTMTFLTATTTVNGSYSFAGTTQIQSGTVSFNGATSIATLDLTGAGTMTGTGLVTVSGTMTWAGGIVSGTGGLTIASGATLNITATAYYVELYTTLNNQGTVVEAGVTYGVYVRNPGVINNSGSWTVSSNDTVHADSGVVVFNNNSSGTFVQSGVTGTTTWQVPINGSGSINVTSGTLILNGASIGSITGPIAVQTGAVLDYNQGGTLNGGQVTGGGTFIFTATTTVNGKYSFAGTTQIQSGTVSFSGATSMVNLILNGSGTMTGTGLVTVSGTMTWAGGIVSGTGGLTIASGATLNITATAYYVELYTTLNNQGTVVEAGVTYGIYVRNPAVINNSGTWTITSNDTVIADQGAVVFNNTGTFVQNGVTGTTTWQVPINNSGSIQIDSGTLNLSGGLTQTAGSTSLGGGSLDCACTLKGGSFTGIGTVTGSITNTGANLAPGTASTFGTISIVGTYSQSGTGSYTWNVGGSSCNEFDAVSISGAATLGGGLNLFNVSGCSPSNGTNFTAMTFGSKTGQFATSSSGWTVGYTATTVVATFEGGGGQPAVTLTPTKLTFATQVVGTTSKAKTIKVSNTGTAPLTISNIALGGTDPGDFSQTNNCTVVNAGQSCTVSVKFTPSTDGSRSATLTLTDNAGTGTQTAPLAGVGTFLNVSPNPIAFPSQLLNTASAPMTITLQNVSPTTAVTVSSVTITGADASDYAQNSTCGVIAANGTCTFTMTFTPSAVGKRAASLKIVENGGGSPRSIPVSGLGTYVTLSPSPVAFGDVAMGNTASATVTLTNQNPTTAVSVSAVSISGTDKKDFTASASSECASVAANGGTCTITVNFKPTAKGARSGILSVKDNDAGSPQTDNLTGTGQ